jgi:ribosomally synthesized peptide (two-chain TOMM family)
MSAARREEMPKQRQIHPAPKGQDDTADAYAKAKRWQLIWPQVIAMAWADSEFKKALIDDPHGTILKHFNYELSKELHLKIEVARSGYYNPFHNKEQEDPWQGLPLMELTLYIPPAPPEKHQAIAVTAYSDTGRTYPMTSG